ncbi:MAG TPA: hypothetical protein VHX65_08585 [Pirellulales bacterium]|nr:hypothetical protein [Pirellulales bacterium]
MATATCPKCHLQVSLPNTDDHTVWVRCPLCGGQYSLRTALDHVPPSLEILGPAAAASTAAAGEMVESGGMAAAAGMAAFGEMHAPNMPAGEMPVHELAGHELQAHGEMGTPADTLAHPEHGAMLAPLADEHFLHADQGANGEHTAQLASGAPSDHAAAQPLGLDQVGSEPHDLGEHLGDFDLDATEHNGLNPEGAFIGHGGLAAHELAAHEVAEHPEHAGEEGLLEHDPSEALFGEVHEGTNDRAGGEHEHAIGPNGEHVIQPSDATDGDPEFQFADAEAGAEEDGGDEQQAMGGIATMVKTAPPPKKRRQAPLMVKVVGVLVGLGFGVIGCYLVFGVFLLIGNHEASMWGQQFHLKSIYPTFVSKHIADEPTPPAHHAKTPEKLTAGSTPVANPVAPPASPDNGGPPATPGTPAANALAQQPDKTSTPLETFEDPTKAPPSDLEKPNSSKPDLSKPDVPSVASPKFEEPALPFGDKTQGKTPDKTPDKTADKTPEKLTTPAVPEKVAPAFEDPTAKPDKPAVTPEKPATTPDKPAAIPAKPETPAVPPETTLPAGIPPTGKTPDKTPEAPPEKTVEKPVVPVPEKPDEHPAPTAEAQPPAADQLAKVDVALTLSEQTSENLKSAAPGADRSSRIKASVANYKAMSHLATELGALGSPSADPAFAARIEALRKKAAALAETMGSPAERDTTAMLAGKWIASPSRKEGGAVIVGTLVKIEPADKGFVAHIKMPSDSKELAFTTAKKPEAAEGSPVVVLGLLNADDGGTAIEILPSSDDKSAAPPPADKPATDKPATDKSATDKPATDNAAPVKPAADKPAADKAAADKPAAQ